MRSVCLWSLLSLALVAVAPRAAAQQVGAGYEISGQHALLAGQKVYLLASGKGLPRLDSAQADATGKFVLRGRVPAPDLYYLRVGQQKSFQPLPLAGQERIATRLDQQKAFEKDEPDMLLLRPVGSDSPALALFAKSTKYFLLKYKTAPAGDKQLREFKALLRANAGSFLAPLLAHDYLRMQDAERPFLDSLTTRFAVEQPASPYLPRLRELLAAGNTLDVGAVAPDLTLAGADGTAVKLSSLRGQYVLLDFWASWCKPCRAENPHVLAAYQKFQKQGPGFTVYAVSLDDNAAKWQRAVQEDKLPWTQVVDLAAFKGATAKQYKLWAIPTTYLLDPEGRIVAKNLRGDELSKELGKRLR